VLIKLAKDKINFIEVPIATVYENGNRETHFRPVKDSFLIYAQIIKFALSSLLSFAVDISLFSLFYATVFASFADKIIYSTVAARVLSGIFNYNVNKRAVFGADGKSLKYLAKYASLFLILMVLSSISVKALANINQINVTFIKIAADTVLFILSFIVQKLFIFKNIKNKNSGVINL
jgi:putative flippase GtrA